MGLAQQSQAIFETFEQLRSLKGFVSFVKPISFEKKHESLARGFSSFHLIVSFSF